MAVKTTECPHIVDFILLTGRQVSLALTDAGKQLVMAGMISKSTIVIDGTVSDMVNVSPAKEAMINPEIVVAAMFRHNPSAGTIKEVIIPADIADKLVA